MDVKPLYGGIEAGGTKFVCALGTGPDDVRALTRFSTRTPDETLAEFCRGADLLVAECSLPDDRVGDNHLSPSRVARLASRSDPRRLVATHIYPQFRNSADVASLIAASGFGGPIDLAREGLVIDL